MEKCDDLGYLLNRVSRLSKCEVNKRLGEFGITFPQYAVIKHLYRLEQNNISGEMQTPAGIAEELRYDRPTITGIIDRLMKQEWVLKVLNPQDRRSHNIMLTDKSRELIHAMDGIFDEVNQKSAKGLSGNELRELKENLRMIITNLEAGEESK